MSWINDVGGMHGFGRVPVDASSARASGPWAARIWAINRALITRGIYNFDHYRHAVERIDPATYLSTSSDERRLCAVETLVKERLPKDSRTVVEPTAPPSERASAQKPRFSRGDTVVVNTDSPLTHTRTPRYVRGRPGTIECVRGWSVPPEERVVEVKPPTPQPVYSVRFEARQLWGQQGDARCPVFLDLWEGHLSRPAWT